MTPDQKYCQGCTACCQFAGFPPFHPDTNLDLLLPASLVEEIKEEMEKATEPRHRCLWLTEEGLCRYYDLRPGACRNFKVEPDTPNSPCDELRRRYHGPDNND